MQSRNYRILTEFILMLVVSAALYLPFIAQFGYYNDDWYSMYAARVAGPQIFHEVYGIDRPGRAYLMIPLYFLFQGNPLYYNISAYVFRLLGSVILLWLLRLVWRERKTETFLIAFLFLIYPGFLSMPNGIDFQSHLIAICLVFLSLGMSLLAIRKGEPKQRIFWWSGAVLTGWAYLSQMEYYIGFEAARLLLFGVFAWRDHPDWKKVFAQVLYNWLPYAPIAIFYLIWRVLFFNNERAATDISLQLGTLTSAPLATLYDWVGHFVQSFLNVTVLAWSVPLTLLSFGLDTSNNIRGITLATVVVLISLLVLRSWKHPVAEQDEISSHWREEMLVVGFFWTIAGLVIVILANRVVLFPAYSRYGMVSAAGALMALVAGISYLAERRLQISLLAFLFFSATLTHYANGLQQASYAQSMRAFWWQVAWRVPQFADGATIIANYPNSSNREESFVWGPANQIYYPYRIKPNSIRAGVYAILLDHDAEIKILNRERQLFHKRVIVDTYKNYRNFVILSRPSWASCVQVIDGRQPEFSRHEIDPILVTGSYSEVEHIVLDEEFKTPPQFLFGEEPAHGWCYYYEKATYERQKGNWQGVLEMGEQAFQQGLYPGDLIEWMPFLQAYAQTGDVNRLTELATTVNTDPYIARQACHILNSMPELDATVIKTVNSLYCSN